MRRTSARACWPTAATYGRPWFGQLMAGPQMMAYLIQIDAWMRRFGLEI